MLPKDTPMNEAQNLGFLMLCGETVDDLTELSIRADEKHLIASNAEWIAQAAFVGGSLSFGIYNKDTAVGLISLIDPRVIEPEKRDPCQPVCLYVWRLMIDHKHRGQGFGEAAIKFAQGYARLIGLNGRSLTTMDKAQGNALAFYERCGFVPTGRRVDDEIELMLVSSSI